MDLLVALSVLCQIACSAATFLFGLSFFGILWTTARSAWKYRQTGWQIAIAYAVLTLTIYFWTTGLSWAFVESGFVVAPPAGFYE